MTRALCVAVALAAATAAGCQTNQKYLTLAGVKYRPLNPGANVTELPQGSVAYQGRIWVPAEGPAVPAPAPYYPPVPVEGFPTPMPSGPMPLPAPKAVPPGTKDAVPIPKEGAKTSLPATLPEYDPVIPEARIIRVRPAGPPDVKSKGPSEGLLGAPVAAPGAKDLPLPAPTGALPPVPTLPGKLPDRLPDPDELRIPPPIPAVPTVPVPPLRPEQTTKAEEPAKLPPTVLSPVIPAVPTVGIPKITVPPGYPPLPK